jgi:hypothetical protein
MRLLSLIILAMMAMGIMVLVAAGCATGDGCGLDWVWQLVRL